MEILDIKNIDFNKLEFFSDVNSTESSLYFAEELFYKLYDGFLLPKTKEKKLLLLNDGEKIPGVVIPNILIKNDTLLCGCAMPYIKNAHSIIKYRQSIKFIMLLYAVSLSLKKIHNDPRNIVVGDLHFNNILIDNKSRHYFVDFDSCMIDDIPQDRLPKCFIEYVNNRGKFKFNVSSRTDKLCMFLSTINALFGKKIDDLSIKEYDIKAERISTLRNMRSYFLELKKNSTTIPDLPYLSDLISMNDFPGGKIKMRKK